MRELLPDNIALAERLATLPLGLAPPKPPGERDIGGDRALATWVFFCDLCGDCGSGAPRTCGRHAGLLSSGGVRGQQIWGQWMANIRRGVPSEP